MMAVGPPAEMVSLAGTVILVNTKIALFSSRQYASGKGMMKVITTHIHSLRFSRHGRRAPNVLARVSITFITDSFNG